LILNLQKLISLLQSQKKLNISIFGNPFYSIFYNILLCMIVPYTTLYDCTLYYIIIQSTIIYD